MASLMVSTPQLRSTVGNLNQMGSGCQQIPSTLHPTKIELVGHLRRWLWRMAWMLAGMEEKVIGKPCFISVEMQGWPQERVVYGRKGGCHDNGQVPKEDARRSMETEVEVPRATTDASGNALGQSNLRTRALAMVCPSMQRSFANSEGPT
ncbi:hypothetical protein CRG98_043100 [Punica granatum]|uniref:Uncharacterized protein n=1 Tax=Punica granatum TaxID=22663 RepID=A0A2I0HXS2_PUNGR|nr:hypothetical protein CRG98_043100 [Punica granatum]